MVFVGLRSNGGSGGLRWSPVVFDGLRGSACGTCPFEARLFILGLTSVVCHILSCFRGHAHDRA